MSELEKITRELNKVIIGYYEPPTSRWRRNYTDRADWYWVWEMNGGKLD